MSKAAIACSNVKPMRFCHARKSSGLPRWRPGSKDGFFATATLTTSHHKLLDRSHRIFEHSLRIKAFGHMINEAHDHLRQACLWPQLIDWHARFGEAPLFLVKFFRHCLGNEPGPLRVMQHNTMAIACDREPGNLEPDTGLQPGSLQLLVNPDHRTVASRHAGF